MKVHNAVVSDYMGIFSWLLSFWRELCSPLFFRAKLESSRKLWSRIEPVATHGTVNIGYKASLKLESTNEEGEPMFQISGQGPWIGTVILLLLIMIYCCSQMCRWNQNRTEKSFPTWTPLIDVKWCIRMYSGALLLICVYPSQKLNNKEGFKQLNNNPSNFTSWKFNLSQQILNE